MTKSIKRTPLTMFVILIAILISCIPESFDSEKEIVQKIIPDN